jgi:polyhydroxybutyrate depolymerase
MPVAGSTATPAGSSGGDVPVAGTSAPMTQAGTSGGSAAGAGGTTTPPPPEMEACPTTALQPGNSNETIMIGSMRRTYILHVPPSYKGDKPVPLVIDWHPLFTSASYESTASGYAAKADQEGFIVAFPDGIDAAWNVGPCCTSSRDVDDLGLARGMVAAIEQRACIDKKRVYSVGFSMGGGMTLFLACNAADIFASFAPAAFDLLEENEEPCHPPRPVAVLAFRGTADPIVPYTGGASNPPNGLPITIHFLGAKGTSDKLAMLDGCMGSPMMGANGCSMYSQCNDGVEVGLCTKTGGSHETGDPNVAWPFLMAHPMP